MKAERVLEKCITGTSIQRYAVSLFERLSNRFIRQPPDEEKAATLVRSTHKSMWTSRCVNFGEIQKKFHESPIINITKSSETMTDPNTDRK